MDEVFVGLIEMFPYGFAPMGWSLCNGAVLQCSQYSDLSSLIGAKFGGDGVKTFALPNLMGIEPVPGTNYYIALFGIYPQRS